MTEWNDSNNFNPTRIKHHTPNEQQGTMINQYELDAFFYAGFGRRFFSYIIDLIVLWAATQIILKPIYALTGIDEWQLWIDYFSVNHMLSAVIYFLYFIMMTRYFQQTLGKMILGIKVYTKDIDQLQWPDILMREWIGRIISNIMIGIPYLAIIFTPKHIGVHDYFADTVVVKQKYIQQIKASRNQMRAKTSSNRYNSEARDK
ncbi:RDD family protein [Staphylococcus sp. 17KM0847]|uniref:RDD family protein n=1 Tax=Staphylococcus sp. 17KM0847 TaxID=2583989 RepID=UPI0015DCF36C|nr:RDD family protein [Staphylococcus sp. 17KM0847]QLK86255.1 RDD family protein [Staphylococcus sp. 17KM0847]